MRNAIPAKCANLTTDLPSIALLTGGFDRPYAYGLSSALSAKGVTLDVIGGKEVHSPAMHALPGLTFIDLHPASLYGASVATKIRAVLKLYLGLLHYAVSSRRQVFHILWNNKLQLFDRTVLMLLYKSFGRRIVFTAHNVNAGKRDSNDSFLNRFSLKVQYRLADRIFVHTDKVRDELCEGFGVSKSNVAVIPFGINNAVSNTILTPAEARRRLGFRPDERVILFFGNLRCYKGLEHLVAAMELLTTNGGSQYKLVIAGSISNEEASQYWAEIEPRIDRGSLSRHVLKRIEYIADSETEVFFKAADVVALPYNFIYQSGVLALGYSFGVPVIATNVGSFPEEIVEGRTGFICRPGDPRDLARAIEEYFSSDLFKNLEFHRPLIRRYAEDRYSWDAVAETTIKTYLEIAGRC